MSKKISVAGLNVDSITKGELLEVLARRIRNREKTFMTTLYSEFLYASLKDREARALLNQADIAVPDGIGILWADYFLSQKFGVKNFYAKIAQAWLQIVLTGASILLQPRKLYQKFPEKIVGADLAWDLAELARKHQFSVFIWGGYNDTPEIVKAKFQKQFPGINIVGVSSKPKGDSATIQEIVSLQPNMLLVAFGPLEQERWIVSNLKHLPVTFAVGLGGTFDYIAGKKSAPPRAVRAAGLEWLYRLITQPARIRRIYEAVWGLILALVRFKVFESMPFRKNAVAVVVNRENKILVCKRRIGAAKNGANPYNILSDYWQFPQGGLDEGEEFIAGGQRELAEETGINSVKVIGVAKFINQYHWENGVRPLLSSKYQFKGQEQRTILFRFEGPEREIQLDQAELVEYRWVTKDEVAKVVANERAPHAIAVLGELSEILNNTVEKQA